MLNGLIKDNIKSLLPYKVEEHADMIKLDANENNNASYLLNEKLAEAIMELKVNEYPDSDCVELRTMLAEEFNLSIDQIMVGCGSDQLIALIMDTFIGSGDKMLTHVPTFGMYKIGTQIAGGITVEVPLNEDFSFDLDSFVKAIEREEPKVIFLTNPNNPTGNIMSEKQITKIAQLSKGVVVVDEAYYEFYGESVINLVNEYENLIVLRTFSKAYGLAGARVGYGVASKQLMDILYKVKPPYNVASLSQIAAKVCLINKDMMHDMVREIVKERERMINSLKEIPDFKIFESHANFVLCKIGDSEGAGDVGAVQGIGDGENFEGVESIGDVENSGGVGDIENFEGMGSTKDVKNSGAAEGTGDVENPGGVRNAKAVYNYLLNNKVLVRYFGEKGPLANCLRISVGTKEENELVIKLLKEM